MMITFTTLDGTEHTAVSLRAVERKVNELMRLRHMAEEEMVELDRRGPEGYMSSGYQLRAVLVRDYTARIRVLLARAGV